MELVGKYEDDGLVMDDWRRRVVDEPLDSLKLLKAEGPKLAVRLQLIDDLNSLDSSFDGSTEVNKRIAILREIDAEPELLANMEIFIDKQSRRGARHLRMLERDWLDLLGQGKADEKISTSTLNIRAFEELIASTRRFGKSASASPTAGDIIAGETMKRLAAKTDQELAELEYRGWNVAHLRAEVNVNLVAAARKISNMRTKLPQHPSLCRRLKALPWQNDIALALDTELELRKPDTIENLHNTIPQFLGHLASRPVEDPDFTFTSWSPSPIRQTLVPMVSKDGKEVLLPRDGLPDVHEAILEAMEAETIALQEVITPVLEDKIVEKPAVEEKTVTPIVTEKVIETPVIERKAIVKNNGDESTDAVNGKRASNALAALSTLLANLGLKEDAELVQKEGSEALNTVRRNLAGHVGIEPRDMRVDRILRLAIRLIPRNEEGDDARAELLSQLSSAVSEMGKWSRLRLEARHSGASGHFLNDAITLGIALKRIPGPGISLPLMADKLELPHPTKLVELQNGVNHVVDSIRLPPVGGVRI